MGFLDQYLPQQPFANPFGQQGMPLDPNKLAPNTAAAMQALTQGRGGNLGVAIPRGVEPKAQPSSLMQQLTGQASGGGSGSNTGLLSMMLDTAKKQQSGDKKEGQIDVPDAVKNNPGYGFGQLLGKVFGPGKPGPQIGQTQQQINQLNAIPLPQAPGGPEGWSANAPQQKLPENWMPPQAPYSY